MSKGKRRSQTEWQAIIKQQSDSGLNVISFCQQHGLCHKTFYKYRREAQATSKTGLSHQSFIKIQRPPSPVLTMPALACVLQYQSCKLHIQPDRDNSLWLAQLMKALS